MRFIVIGITDHPHPFFSPEVQNIIRSGTVFSGGKRHHTIMAPLLPANARWIDITVPLDQVFEQYRAEQQTDALIIFASGDPLFFGFANTIRREMPDADIVVYPTFNSLQLLAHHLVMPYHDLRIVSLTGRPWPAFDRALIEQADKIGILTDKEHTPAAIAQRMIDYGYTHYRMHVGQHLGHPHEQRVTTCTLQEATQQVFGFPNCIILERHSVSEHTPSTGHPPVFGIPDQQFALLNGREKMITKMPIRLLTLQALDLPRRSVLWDIGFCTGSVSIEARLQFPHLDIHAFEIRSECEAIIHHNARKMGAPGIHVHMGDFLQTDCADIPAPDAVFIGGHGGQLQQIMTKILSYLSPGGIIVMNSVKAPRVLTDSHQLWDEACRHLSLTQEPPTRIILNDHHPIEILTCRK